MSSGDVLRLILTNLDVCYFYCRKSKKLTHFSKLHKSENLTKGLYQWSYEDDDEDFTWFYASEATKKDLSRIKPNSNSFSVTRVRPHKPSGALVAP